MSKKNKINAGKTLRLNKKQMKSLASVLNRIKKMKLKA
jgi:hypothetical protein